MPDELETFLDALLRDLEIADQNLAPGKDLDAAIYALSLVGNFIEVASRLRRPGVKSPTNTLMRLAHALLGRVDGAEDDPMLKGPERTSRPHIPEDEQFGRAYASALMQFVMVTRELQREPAARLVVDLLGESTLFNGLDGEPWRAVARWRDTFTGKGHSASDEAMQRYHMVLAELLRLVPMDADASRLHLVVSQWRLPKKTSKLGQNSGIPPGKSEGLWA